MIPLLITSIIIFILIMLFYMFKQAFADNVTEETILIEDFPKTFGELKIFFLSDVHRREITDEVLSKVKKKVDIVVIGGDLTEKKVPFARVEANLQKLKTIGAPIYFVWGNNDYETDFRTLDAILLQHGVKVLDNTAVTFESREGEYIQLLGVDELSVEKDNLSLALSDCRTDSFKILAAHNPEIIEKFTEEEKISFVLCGHTHGGQIRIFGFGPYEKGKLHVLSHTKLFISNGYGTSLLPLRLGAPAETHILTLKRG
nr:metallophosphoesterase [Bacillus alkalisoli]